MHRRSSGWDHSKKLGHTTRAEIWRIVRDLRDDEGVTVILTTHYLEEAETVCDRVGILHGGSLVALDQPARLIAQLGEFVVELRTTDNNASVLDSLDAAHLGDRPALVAKGLVSVTSSRPREELAATVARLQHTHHDITAAAVRPTTLNDVYQHLTGDPEATQ